MLQPLIDSFRFFRNNLQNIATLIFVFVLISKIIELATTNLLPPSTSETSVALLQVLLSFLLNAIFQCTFILLLVKINKKQKVILLQCFREAIPFMLFYMLGGIIVNIIVFIGLLVLLVFPGLYAYARLGFFDFAIVIRSEDPIEAIQTSWRITSGSVLRILLTLMPLSVLMLIFMATFTLIDERTFITNTLGSLILWTFGAFFVVLRYRLYLMLSSPKSS